ECDDARKRKQEGVIVAGRKKRGDGGNAIGALAILDHDRLTPALGQPFGKKPPGKVGAAAGRQGNNEAHGVLRPWVALRLGCRGRDGKREAKRESKRGAEAAS